MADSKHPYRPLYVEGEVERTYSIDEMKAAAAYGYKTGRVVLLTRLRRLLDQVEGNERGLQEIRDQLDKMTRGENR